jgi:Flp pilus assembly protein TadG
VTLFHRFWQDENGVLVIKFAVMLPVLLAASAYFYDISVHHNQKTRLHRPLTRQPLPSPKS